MPSRVHASKNSPHVVDAKGEVLDLFVVPLTLQARPAFDVAILNDFLDPSLLVDHRVKIGCMRVTTNNLAETNFGMD
jgi:hypothetical protein